MPKVGKKTFPYTKKGIAAAKAEAKTSGNKITAARSYKDVAKQQAARAKGAPPALDAEDMIDGGADEATETTPPKRGAKK